MAEANVADLATTTYSPSRVGFRDPAASWQWAGTLMSVGNTTPLASVGHVRFEGLTAPAWRKSVSLTMVNGNSSRIPSDPLYLGFVQGNTVPDAATSLTVTHIGDPTIAIDGVDYPVIWNRIDWTPITLSLDLLQYDGFASMHDSKDWDGNLSLFVQMSIGPTDTINTFIGDTVRLTINQLALVVGADNDMSMADHKRGTRWFMCPRCGWWYSIDHSVRDAEKPSLFVCDQGCQDQLGRRDTASPQRERQDRLWPRL